MPFQPAPGVAQASIEFNTNGLSAFNILNFFFAGGNYSEPNIQALAAAIDESIAEAWLGNFSTQTQYRGTTVRGLASEYDWSAFNDTNAGGGERPVNPCPANVTFAVKFYCGLTGRSTRGRAYVPNIAVDLLDGNENMVRLIAAQGYANMYKVTGLAALDASWSHVVLSRVHNGAPRSYGTPFFIQEYTFTDLRVDTQRRRLGR